MSQTVRALRGATTCETDDPVSIGERTVELLEAMFERNGVAHDDLISIWFTTTEDLTSAFPASGARTIGLGDVPLLCAREIPVRWPGASGCWPTCTRSEPAASSTTCTSTTRAASATTFRTERWPTSPALDAPTSSAPA